MKREDREADRRERAENYQRGLIALHRAVGDFQSLTGVTLLDAVDVTGRHMGEAPYLKITAERLAEISREIEGEVEEAGETVRMLAAAVTGDARVLQFSAYRPAVKP